MSNASIMPWISWLALGQPSREILPMAGPENGSSSAPAARRAHIREGSTFCQGECYKAGVMNETQALIRTILARAPEWLRHDLAAKDAVVRQRAEETLAAMVSDALARRIDPAA